MRRRDRETNTNRPVKKDGSQRMQAGPEMHKLCLQIIEGEWRVQSSGGREEEFT